MNWKAWLYSLVSAAIGGASGALGGAVVAPSVFNFTHDGLIKIGQLALFGAAVPVLTLLKQSPLPSIQTTTQTTTLETKTVTTPAAEPAK